MPLDPDKQARVDELMEAMRLSMPEDEWNAITKMAKKAANLNRLKRGLPQIPDDDESVH
jgi:hypothetical protein